MQRKQQSPQIPPRRPPSQPITETASPLAHAAKSPTTPVMVSARRSFNSMRVSARPSPYTTVTTLPSSTKCSTSPTAPTTAPTTTSTSQTPVAASSNPSDSSTPAAPSSHVPSPESSEPDSPSNHLLAGKRPAFLAGLFLFIQSPRLVSIG